MKKAISVLILFVILITSIVACADTPGETGETEHETIIESDRIYPELPEMDFNGETFTMLHWYIGSLPTQDLVVEDLNADLVNDAVYNRNTVIEDRYKIKLAADYRTHDAVITTMQSAVSAGDDSIDVVYVRSHEAHSVLNLHLLYDMSTLPYVDFEQPWWDAKSIKELSLGNHVLLAMSDITLLDKEATSCIMFNKNVQTDFNIPDLYALVYQNEWTFDKMIELSRGILFDVDGNSEYDLNDRYGIIGSDDTTYIMLEGGNAKYALKDEDDYPYCAFDNERTIEVATKVLTDIMYNDEIFSYGGGRDMFSDDRGLFFIERVNNVVSLRNMETDFGIIPVPKYDSAQENFCQAVSIHNSSLLTVPLTCADPERTGFILEALSAESKYTVLEAYYDIALKDKYTRDEESTDMLDLIFENRTYDLGEFMMFGGFNTAYLRIYSTKNSNISSLYASYEKKIDSDIDKLIKVIDKYGE